MSALAALEALGDPGRAAEAAAYHKAPRVYLGVPVPQIEALAADWRAERDVAGRVRLAAELWDSDVHEARIAAAKLLTQARMGADEALVWDEFLRWVPTFDAWAIADQACKAGERRLAAAPERLDRVEEWLGDPNLWVRRATLVATLPWTKQNHPTAAERAARERVLGWAEALVAGSRLVRPEGDRLVAAQPVDPRSRPGPRVPRGAGRGAQGVRAQGRGAAAGRRDGSAGLLTDAQGDGASPGSGAAAVTSTVALIAGSAIVLSRTVCNRRAAGSSSDRT